MLILLVLAGRLPFDSTLPLGGRSYLGDFSQDDSSVLLALSQSLHGSQEFFPVLYFLHHCTEGRGHHCTGQWKCTGPQACMVSEGYWVSIKLCCSLVSPNNSHTHTQAHIHQTGPAQELGLLA